MSRLRKSSAIVAIALGLAIFAVILAILMSIGSDSYPSSGSYQYTTMPSTPPQNPSQPISPLPPGQGGGTIFPIPPDTIIPDPADSSRTIISDRLNILLEKERPSTGKDFMSEFKTLYPSPDYEFVYFDTLTYRMQIKLPPDKRTFLRDNLNSQMPDYNFIVFDEEVFSVHSKGTDPGFSDANKSWYFDNINVEKAWDITMGNPDITVAVVDNGFDLSHPEFKGKIVSPINIPEHSTNLFPIKHKEHGTHVAATAIGNINNNSGLSGIAPNCKFMPVQIATSDGMMPMTTLIDGILYAVYNHADVVNVSIGPEAPETLQFVPYLDQIEGIQKSDQRMAEVWRKVYEIADNYNCIIVVAAGNENIVSGYSSQSRANSVIIVSATDQNNNKTWFSNYGYYPALSTNYSSVSAPGEAIYSAVFDGRYEYMQGTSMAAPIVSGIVALMKSLDPDMKVAEAKNILQRTGIELTGDIGPLVQADKALEYIVKKNNKNL